MDGALIVVLVVAWAVVLLPSAVRSRRSSPSATVGGFEHAMDVLRSRPPGREVMVPGDAARIVSDRGADRVLRSVGPEPGAPAGAAASSVPSVPGLPSGNVKRAHPVLARRRRTFHRLAGATAAVLLLAVVFDGVVWTLAFLSAAVLAGYVVLLRRWKLQRDEAREVVRTLRTTQRRHEAEPMARAVGEVAHDPEGWGGIQVATRPDQPWQRGTGVRIRRWDDGR